MRGRVLPLMFGLVAMFSSRADLDIVEFQNTETLKWTNTVANATYRIEASPRLSGVWTNVAVVTASTNVVTYPLSVAPLERLQFFRVVWIDAPAAQPVGEWIYNGYEGTQLAVTGLVSFAQSEPLSGTVTFRALAAPGEHPSGSASFTNATTSGANGITIPLPDSPFAGHDFQIAGQMAGDEFFGEWLYWDSQGGIFGPRRVVIVKGRFSARRK